MTELDENIRAELAQALESGDEAAIARLATQVQAAIEARRSESLDSFKIEVMTAVATILDDYGDRLTVDRFTFYKQDDGEYQITINNGNLGKGTRSGSSGPRKARGTKYQATFRGQTLPVGTHGEIAQYLWENDLFSEVEKDRVRKTYEGGWKSAIVDRPSAWLSEIYSEEEAV